MAEMRKFPCLDCGCAVFPFSLSFLKAPSWNARAARGVTEDLRRNQDSRGSNTPPLPSPFFFYPRTSMARIVRDENCTGLASRRCVSPAPCQLLRFFPPFFPLFFFFQVGDGAVTLKTEEKKRLNTIEDARSSIPLLPFFLLLPSIISDARHSRSCMSLKNPGFGLPLSPPFFPRRSYCPAVADARYSKRWPRPTVQRPPLFFFPLSFFFVREWARVVCSKPRRIFPLPSFPPEFAGARG